MQTDEARREEIYKFTNIELVNSQSSKGMSTEGQIEQSKELTTIHSDKGNITELNMKISNIYGCFALRNNLCFWISKKQKYASWYTVGAEGRETR